MINELFETMILQVQGFFKDMNAQCNVLNIGQPVLQVMHVLNVVSRVLKNDHKVLKLVPKGFLLRVKFARMHACTHTHTNTHTVGGR